MSFCIIAYTMYEEEEEREGRYADRVRERELTWVQWGCNSVKSLNRGSMRFPCYMIHPKQPPVAIPTPTPPPLWVLLLHVTLKCNCRQESTYYKNLPLPPISFQKSLAFLSFLLLAHLSTFSLTHMQQMAQEQKIGTTTELCRVRDIQFSVFNNSKNKLQYIWILSINFLAPTLKSLSVIDVHTDNFTLFFKYPTNYSFFYGISAIIHTYLFAFRIIIERFFA